MIVGYARVSSKDQSLELQKERLKHCEKIFEEKKSGTTYERPELKECLNFVRDGDTLTVTRLDRLARSTLDLCNIAKRLEDKNVFLHVIEQHINTSDATGRLMFNMLGAIGQFETEIRSERQMEGIRKALNEGVHFGRVNLLKPHEIDALRQQRKDGDTIKVLARRFAVSPSTIYRYVRTFPEEIESVL